MLSTYYPLCNSLWDCTGFFKFLSPYFLRLSSTTIYTRVPSLDDVACHLLHPMVLWHLAHCLMIFNASAFLIQLYDIQLEQPSPFTYHSSFQDSSRRKITLIRVTFFPSSFPFQELWGSFHLSEFLEPISKVRESNPAWFSGHLKLTCPLRELFRSPK